MLDFILNFAMWWICSGIVLTYLYIFVYHGGPTKYLDFFDYSYEHSVKNCSDTNEQEKMRMEYETFVEARKHGSDFSFLLFPILLFSCIPILVPLMILGDHSKQKEWNGV